MDTPVLISHKTAWLVHHTPQNLVQSLARHDYQIGAQGISTQQRVARIRQTLVDCGIPPDMLKAIDISVVFEFERIRTKGVNCVSLNEVVLGRYTFVFLNYFTSMVVIIILYLGFVLCRKATFDVPDIMLGLGLSFLVFSTITGIQMPLFFKMGYTKAKLWSVIPFAVVMLLVVLPSFVSALSGILDFAQSHKELFAFACILTSCIIQFVSYHIAVIFYRKQR